MVNMHTYAMHMQYVIRHRSREMFIGNGNAQCSSCSDFSKAFYTVQSPVLVTGVSLTILNSLQ